MKKMSYSGGHTQFVFQEKPLQFCKSKCGHSFNEVHEPLSSDASYFCVETIATNFDSNQAFVTLSLCPKHVPIQFKQVNVIPERIFCQLQYSTPLEQPARHLSAYTGDKLDVHGRCKLKCRFEGQDSELELLTKSWSCLDLELIKQIYSVDHTDTLEACDTQGWLKKKKKKNAISVYADVSMVLG